MARVGAAARTVVVTCAIAVIAAAAAVGGWLLARSGPAQLPPGVVGVPAHHGNLPAAEAPGPTQLDGDLAYGPDPAQRLDLYRPPGVAGRLPVLIFLHSGGWVAGQRQDVPSFVLREVSHLQLVVASVDYRLSTTAGANRFPAAPQDVDRSIRWLVANASRLALDPSRIVVSGTSAGGHLAALAGAAPGAFVAPDLPASLRSVVPHVIGVIDAAGPSDMDSFGREHGLATTLVASFLGCTGTKTVTCDAATMTSASIAPHLTAAAPPAFLIYGAHDTLAVPRTQGRPLAAAWALARGDLGRPPADRGVYYEEADDGHNLSQATVDMGALEGWLSAVLSGRLG